TFTCGWNLGFSITVRPLQPVSISSSRLGSLQYRTLEPSPNDLESISWMSSGKVMDFRVSLRLVDEAAFTRTVGTAFGSLFFFCLLGVFACFLWTPLVKASAKVGFSFKEFFLVTVGWLDKVMGTIGGLFVRSWLGIGWVPWLALRFAISLFREEVS